MTFEELVSNMNAEMYGVVKEAVELGKWPDGTLLDAEQKSICMRAMIVYENKYLEPSQRTGFMPGDQLCESEGGLIQDVLTESPLKWH